MLQVNATLAVYFGGMWMREQVIGQVAVHVFNVHVGEDNYWSRDGGVYVRIESGNLKCKCPQGKFGTRHCDHRLLVLIACDLNGQSITPSKPFPSC